MAGDPKNPKVGEFVFDGSEFNGELVDLSPGDLQGLLTEREGYPEAVQEILANHAAFGDKAGVTATDIATIRKSDALIARIDVFLQPVAKFYEMLTETRYLLDDRRQRIVFNIGQSAERRGKEVPELLAKYQQTRSYRSAVAKKAARTRAKNAGDANGGNGGGNGAPDPRKPVEPPRTPEPPKTPEPPR